MGKREKQGWERKATKNVQDPRGKHESDTNLLLPIHLHPPHQWQRHDDQREIGNDVTEAVDVGDIPGFGLALRLWILEKLEVPGGFDGPACKDGQEHGDRCPDTEDPTDDPCGHAEPSVDVEDAIEEEEQRGFGEGDGDDVEVSVHGEHLVFAAVRDMYVCIQLNERWVYGNVAVEPLRGDIPDVTAAAESISLHAVAGGTPNGDKQCRDDGVCEA